MLPRHHIILMSVLFSVLQHIFVNTAHHFFCFLHGHLLLTKAHIVVFLFFNESSSSSFPYFSLSAHRLPYFFKPLVFLLISTNPNTTSLSTLLTHFFCFYMAIYYSQKHILSSSSLFLFFNKSSSSLFLFVSTSSSLFLQSLSIPPYFFKPKCNTSLSTLLTSFFCFLHGRLLLTKAHLVVFLLISLLQRVVFHLISLFLFVSTSSSLFLQTLSLPPHCFKP
jgi:hypothetical protein